MDSFYENKKRAQSQSGNLNRIFQDNLKCKLESVEEINSFLRDDVYKILYQPSKEIPLSSELRK